MNNFSKVAVITAALALIAQGAKAANANEDLVLGFTDSSLATDYTVDLGSAATVGAGGSQVVDLSGDVSSSTYTSTFTSGTVTAGVAGGESLSTGTAYMTVTRSGAGTPSTPGSLTPQATSGNMLGSVAKAIGNHANSAVLGVDSESDVTSGSWTQEVVTYAANNAGGYTPQTTLSGTVYEDLYSTPNNKSGQDTTWTYLGYFTFNFSNPNSPVVEFTGSNVAVPEPATYGFLAGAGLLVVALSRQFARA